MSESGSASHSNEPPNPPDNQEEKEESQEPEPKKMKMVDNDLNEKLEQRLWSILCCTVCLDLPASTVYQCSNGHLVCAACFMHLLADAKLKDEVASCPTCRVEFSKQSPPRNLAVEKAVSELPFKCQYCCEEYPRHALERHEEHYCEGRMTRCKYNRIGCPWRGPYCECSEHEQQCAYHKKTGAEVLEELIVMDEETKEERLLYNNLLDLLSFEKITFNDLQLKMYRTDEFVQKLLFETSRFSAFGHVWVVNVRINDFQSDPVHSSGRKITYQLVIKSKPNPPITIHYLVVKGAYGDMKVKPKIYKCDFSETDCESPYNLLPLPDTLECNRLLVSKTINFRIIMVMVVKQINS